MVLPHEKSNSHGQWGIIPQFRRRWKLRRYGANRGHECQEIGKGGVTGGNVPLPAPQPAGPISGGACRRGGTPFSRARSARIRGRPIGPKVA